MADDWVKAWQPLIDAIGRDFGADTGRWGADAVEAGSVRRFLEPLEFDCPLHYDHAAAQQAGYSDVIAPCSSITTFTIPPLWQPGEQVFTSAERNAQPASSPVASASLDLQGLAPPTTGFFATDLEIDYLLPAVLGDRLRSVGRKLVSVVPRETRVGRGAFLVWESEVRNQHDAVVARMRFGMFLYNPHEAGQP